MKIALITDTHFGARNDSLPFNEYFYKFWENIFFPYIDKNNIKTIIHLGDTMDRRKFVSYKIANDFRRRFITPIVDRKLDTHILIGNHDTYYKNTNEVNSVQELVGNKYDNIKYYTESNTDLLMVHRYILFLGLIQKTMVEQFKVSKKLLQQFVWVI